MNVTDSIWRTSYAYPDAPAVIFDGRTTSYGQLRTLADIASSRLHTAGVRAGDCVAVSVSSPLVYVTSFLALARLGAVCTPMHVSMVDARKEALVQRNRPVAVIEGRNQPWRSTTSDLMYLVASDLFEPLQKGQRLAKAPVAAEADQTNCLISLSSGTTGVPKSIPLTHAAMTFAINVSDASYANSRVLIYADITLSVGLMRVLRTLSAGSVAIIAHEPKAQKTFELLETHRATHLVTTTGMGISLVRHAEQSGRAPTPLPHLVSARLMGAAVSPKLAEGVVTYLCPNLEVGYGSTEAGGIAVVTPGSRQVQPASAGRLLPWVDAQVVNERDEVLAPGVTGTLRFRTMAMAAGYLGDPAATAKYFRQGWFYPGDLGSIDAGGFLFLAGRSDEMLNLSGRKINPEVIEGVLNAHPAVHESAVVALATNELSVPELVAAVIVKSPVGESELIDLCRSKLGRQEIPSRCVFVMDLPKNAGGKILRKELAEMLRPKRPEHVTH